MKTKHFLTLIAVLSLMAVNAQTKKELKQNFENNIGVVSQVNYEFVPEAYFSVGEHTAWQTLPESSNYFKIKGDSVFVKLHYTVKNKNGLIEYSGLYYNKELIEEKKLIKAKLSTTKVATDGVSFELTIKNDGYITMVAVEELFTLISYKGTVQSIK